MLHPRLRLVMNTSDLIKSGLKVCSAKYLNMRIPVFLILELTYRCNLRCAYCRRWSAAASDEMDTKTVLRIISEGKRLGLLRVYLTGGEVFLREDLGCILSSCKNMGLMTEVWTNASLLDENQSTLKHIDCLAMSLDGPEPVHDEQRQKGSFVRTVRAAELARKAGIHISFNFTLTSGNLNSFAAAVKIASDLKATIGLQPVAELAGGLKDLNKLMPSEEEFKKALNEAISLKKRYPLIIENSFRHLNYLKSWPKAGAWSCLHGRAIFTVTPSGHLVACTNSPVYYPEPIDLASYSLRDAVKEIHDFPCRGCYCYGAYDASGAGSLLPVSPEVFKFHVMRKWRKLRS